MADWRIRLARAASEVEVRIDAARVRRGLRRGTLDPVRVLPYRGFGTPHELRLRGRVVARQEVRRATANDTAWRNTRDIWRRFLGTEIPRARVRAHFGRAGATTTDAIEAVTDEEGFFTLHHAPVAPLPAGQVWHEVALELVAPKARGQGASGATAHVLVPPPDAEFGVISDIDDTIVETGATSLLTMARIVLFNNAHTRLPFQGVAAFYQALQLGADGRGHNPLFYVSSSPWNLYDLLVDFLDINNIPVGPLFLQDWGLGRRKLVKTGHQEHKLTVIRDLLATYPTLPFLLIGDSGEADVAIYRQAAREHPGRVRAIYIRDTLLELQAGGIRTITEELRAGDTPLLLVSDTVAAATHAVEQGFIQADTLPTVRAEKVRDRPRGPRFLARLRSLARPSSTASKGGRTR